MPMLSVYLAGWETSIRNIHWRVTAIGVNLLL